MPESEPETIFVASNPKNGGPRVVHLEEDCYRLGSAHDTTEKELAVYPPNARKWCSWCGPDADDPAEYGGMKGGVADD